MPLTLFLHPLSSYCHKVLIALYENATPFKPHLIELQKPGSRDTFKAIWPVGKFPVLRDEASGRVIPESTTIIEYLQLHHPGPVKLIPADADAAFDVRALDRFFDLHVHTHVQRIIGERLRPAGNKDPFGLEQARAALDVALGIAEKNIAGRPGRRVSISRWPTAQQRRRCSIVTWRSHRSRPPIRNSPPISADSNSARLMPARSPRPSPTCSSCRADFAARVVRRTRGVVY